MSALEAAVKNSATAGSSKRIRRNLLIFFYTSKMWPLDLLIAMSLFDVWLGHSHDVIKASGSVSEADLTASSCVLAKPPTADMPLRRPQRLDRCVNLPREYTTKSA